MSSRTFKNPRLVNTRFLSVQHGDKNTEVTLDLDTCLGAAEGKFFWGGKGGFSAAKKCVLKDGMVLYGELENNGKWAETHIDLSTNLEIVNGKLEYKPSPASAAAPPLSFSSLLSHSEATTALSPSSFSSMLSQSEATAASAASAVSTSFSNSSVSLSKAISESSFAQYFKKSFESSSSSEQTYTERSSSYFKLSIESLELKGSILQVKFRKAGEQNTIDSELDLDHYIGIVSGKLVWGRKGFFSSCQKVWIEKDTFTLFAECTTTSGVITSSIILTRYLHIYGGKLGVKVEITGDDMSDLFSEARWLKFKIVTEFDSEEAVKIIQENAAFKSAFSALAKTTQAHISEEMEQVSSLTATQFVVDEKLKAKATKIVLEELTLHVQKEIDVEITKSFEVARAAILKACNDAEMAVRAATDKKVKAAAGKVAIKVVEAVIGPMQVDFHAHSQHSLKAVSASAIAHFQERAEIMMEQQIIRASIRRAQTKSHLLSALTAGGVF